jgi:Kef-type K+ transport system membrane component KefB
VSTAEATQNAETIGIVGGILLLVVLAVAYYAGGYVAGRLARFDGARQGAGVWVLGLLITVALAVAGVVLGSEYNILNQLNLPRIPIDEGSLTTGGIIALVAAVLVTLLAAVAGGKVGERFHRKVDRVGR